MLSPKVPYVTAVIHHYNKAHPKPIRNNVTMIAAYQFLQSSFLDKLPPIMI